MADEHVVNLTRLGHDVQLKILQALPSLLHNYPIDLRGELLSTVLQICSSLQSIKSPAVSNTAAATLQQLVTAIFDRVSVEDGRSLLMLGIRKTLTLSEERALEIPIATEVKGDDGPVPVRPAANDAYKVRTLIKRVICADHVRYSTISTFW